MTVCFVLLIIPVLRIAFYCSVELEKSRKTETGVGHNVVKSLSDKLNSLNNVTSEALTWDLRYIWDCTHGLKLTLIHLFWPSFWILHLHCFCRCAHARCGSILMKVRCLASPGFSSSMNNHQSRQCQWKDKVTAWVISHFAKTNVPHSSSSWSRVWSTARSKGPLS